jgi:hypothetical protein
VKPKPIYIEGAHVVHASTDSLIDIEMPEGTRFKVESSNAILIEQIAKLTKFNKRKLRLTIEVDA